jgi:chromatin-remodeling ATPase INO80
VAKPSEIVQLLLNDEQLANLGNTPALSSTHTVTPSNTDQAPVQDLWADEGDDFLAQPGLNAITNGNDTPEEDKQMRSGPGRGKGRGKSTRGRKKRRGGGPSDTLA